MITENKKIADVLNLAKNFTPKEWAEFLHLSRKFRKADLPDYKSPISTSDDAKDLLNILVDATIDFLKERKLDDVYEVLKELYEEQQEYGVSPLVVDGATGFIFINKVGKTEVGT